jgi:tRNA 2-selenouridine synthase
VLFQDVTIEELLELRSKGNITMIDVRSPSEYEDASFPDSLNIPLFDDSERAEVGTLYKQVSSQAAKDRGLEIVSAKLPSFIKSFERIEGRKAVFCWRGGMRSKTTATVLSLMGIRVYRLIGGIRAYRKWVVETLENFKFHPKAIVLNGNTGSGKTLILHRLRELGFPVMDLEAMAGHRGSIFGQIGLKPNNQKTFESLLLEELIRLGDSPYVLMEAESKRIGKVVLPDFIIDAKRNGVQLFIEMPVEVRVQHILNDYKPWEYKEACMYAFQQIKSRIHTPIAAEIEALLQADRFADAVQLLLEHYYDKRYEYALQQNAKNPIILKVNHVDEAVKAVVEHLSKVTAKG